MADIVTYPCAACGKKNRFPRARLREDPTCGRCKGKVFPRAPVTVTDATWQAEVADSPLPVLVDFWAPWCGPCKTIAPVLEAVARDWAGRLKIAKVNVDENTTTPARFGVQGIPTMVLLRGPLELDQIVGAVSQASLEARLDRFI